MDTTTAEYAIHLEARCKKGWFTTHGDDPDSLRKTAIDLYPNLALRNFTIERRDMTTNCHAFTFGFGGWLGPEDPTQWWEGAPLDASHQAWTRYLVSHGWVECSREEASVCLYADHAGCVAHSARRQPDGTWASKQGAWAVIFGHELDDLADDCYGQPTVFLK